MSLGVCARPLREASGWAPTPHSATGRSTCRTEPRRAPSWSRTRQPTQWSSASSTWPCRARARSTSPRPSTRRALPAPRASSGSRVPSTPLSTTKPTPAQSSGVSVPRTALPRYAWRKHTPPSSRSASSGRSPSCCAPAHRRPYIPAGPPVPTCSAVSSSARRAARPSQQPRPRAASTPTTSATPCSRRAGVPARPPGSTRRTSRALSYPTSARTSSPRATSGTW